jgi:hypothetical protein
MQFSGIVKSHKSGFGSEQQFIVCCLFANVNENLLGRVSNGFFQLRIKFFGLSLPSEKNSLPTNGTDSILAFLISAE